jgi:antitoxin component of MazEF toxin-antitoxin module
MQDAEVEISVDREGRLSLRRVRDAGYTLEELLEQVRPDNLHGETDTGARTGREVW